jgi:translation initiation factor IF-1
MSPDTGSSSVVQGVVSATLPNARFLCRAADGSEVTCHVAGDMRMKVVRLLPGEGVMIEPSPLDPSKGRIVGKAGRTS